MRRQRPLLLILLGGLLTLVPLAYASPPDPVWVGGIYDGGDYDDIVAAIGSTDSHVDGVAPAIADPCLTFIGSVQAADTVDPAATGLPSVSIRAPPLA